MKKHRALLAVTLALISIPAAFAKADLMQSGFSEDKDGENALDLEDYPRAESIFRSRVGNKEGGAQEGYYRTGLGEAIFWQGRFNESAKEFKRAYSLIDKSEPAASDLRARVLDDLSWLSESKGDTNSAIDYDKQSLAAIEGAKNAEPVHVVGVLEHLGYLLRNSGRYDQAANYYRQALTVLLQTPGADQGVHVADDRELLAQMMRRLGQAADASILYNQAMQVKWNNPALFTAYTPHSYTDTVTYRFYSSAPNCSRINRSGREHEGINIRAVSVSASLDPATKDLAKNAAVSVSIVNDSPYPVQFLPKPPTLTVLAPKVVLSHLVDPAALAATVEKKGEKSAKWVRFWGADKTMPVTTTFMGHPGVWGYPPIYSTYNSVPIINRSGDFTTVTTQVPDYAGQARALQKAADIEDRTREQAQTIRASSLGATTVPPGGNVSGSLYFDTSNIQKAILQIPIGNAIFEFRFPPED